MLKDYGIITDVFWAHYSTNPFIRVLFIKLAVKSCNSFYLNTYIVIDYLEVNKCKYAIHEFAYDTIPLDIKYQQVEYAFMFFNLNAKVESIYSTVSIYTEKTGLHFTRMLCLEWYR